MKLSKEKKEKINGVIDKLTNKKVILTSVIALDVLTLIFIFAIFMFVGIFVKVSFPLIFLGYCLVARLRYYYKVCSIKDEGIALAGSLAKTIISKIPEE